MAYLDEWASLERDHDDAVSGAVEDLEANTLRLPITRGAKVCMFNVCHSLSDFIPGRDHLNYQYYSVCTFTGRY